METMKGYNIDIVSVRLVKDAPLLSENKICSPEDAIQVMGELICGMDREVVAVINLKADGTPINGHIASMGALNQAVAHPRELLKTAILSNAASMIMLHNHPSGSLKPSKEDVALTDRMIHICSMIGIPLQDHVIVGENGSKYFSFREKGILKAGDLWLQTDYRLVEFKEAKVAEQDTVEKIMKDTRKKSR